MLKEQTTPKQEEDQESPKAKHLSHPDLPAEVNGYINTLMKQAGELTQEIEKAKQEKESLQY